MSIEEEMASCISEELSREIDKEIVLVSILENRYAEFAELRRKAELEYAEMKWPQKFRHLRKPGSVAEQFDDYQTYCDWCLTHNEQIGA